MSLSLEYQCVGVYLGVCATLQTFQKAPSSIIHPLTHPAVLLTKLFNSTVTIPEYQWICLPICVTLLKRHPDTLIQGLCSTSVRIPGLCYLPLNQEDTPPIKHLHIQPFFSSGLPLNHYLIWISMCCITLSSTQVLSNHLNQSPH